MATTSAGRPSPDHHSGSRSPFMSRPVLTIPEEGYLRTHCQPQHGDHRQTSSNAKSRSPPPLASLSPSVHSLAGSSPVGHDALLDSPEAAIRYIEFLERGRQESPAPPGWGRIGCDSFERMLQEEIQSWKTRQMQMETLENKSHERARGQRRGDQERDAALRIEPSTEGHRLLETLRDDMPEEGPRKGTHGEDVEDEDIVAWAIRENKIARSHEQKFDREQAKWREVEKALSKNGLGSGRRARSNEKIDGERSRPRESSRPSRGKVQNHDSQPHRPRGLSPTSPRALPPWLTPRRERPGNPGTSRTPAAQSGEGRIARELDGSSRIRQNLARQTARGKNGGLMRQPSMVGVGAGCSGYRDEDGLRPERTIGRGREQDAGDGSPSGVRWREWKRDNASKATSHRKGGQSDGDRILSFDDDLASPPLPLSVGAGRPKLDGINASTHARVGDAKDRQRMADEDNRDDKTARILRAAFNEIPGGLTGWFLQVDSDADGLIETKDLLDALLQLPIRLSSRCLVNFITDLIHSDGNVCLSRLWAAIMCPQLNRKGCVRSALNEVPAGDDGGGDGDSRGRDLDSRRGVDSSSYRALLPNLVYEQFQVEVLEMSRAAGQKLASITKHHDALQERIRHEAQKMEPDHDEEAPWELSFEVFDLTLQLEVVRSSTATVLTVHQRARSVLNSSTERVWDPQEEKRQWLRKRHEQMEPYARDPADHSNGQFPVDLSKNGDGDDERGRDVQPDVERSGLARHDLATVLNLSASSLPTQSSPSNARAANGARAGSGLAYLQSHYPARRRWSAPSGDMHED